MSSTRILLVDDEAPARIRLQRMLEEEPQYTLVGTANTGEAAIELAIKLQPDVVLLDIQMPGMGGLAAARMLAEQPNPPAVIFTTAFDDYALQAFDVNAYGYLLKPIRKSRLLAALAHAAPKEQHTETLTIQNHAGIQRITLDSIYYFKAEQKYVEIYHQAGSHLTDESLKQLESAYEPLLLRIHRNALVAKQYLTGMRKDNEGKYWAYFDVIDAELEISRRHLAQVRQFLKGK